MTVFSKPQGATARETEPSGGRGTNKKAKDSRHWENLERGRRQLQEIETRLQVAAEEIDWATEVEKVHAAEQGKKTHQENQGQETEEKWYGDNMDLKNLEGKVGCRVLTINTNRQSVMQDEGVMNFERDLDYILDMQADIAIIHEPGNTQKIGPTLRSLAEKKNCTAIIKDTGAAQSEGTIIVITGAWRMILESAEVVKAPGFSEARVVMLTFKEAGKQHLQQMREGEEKTPLGRLAVISAYGYADKGKKKEIESMWEEIRRVKNEWKEKYPLSSVLVAGDINAAKWTLIDTDREGVIDQWQLEHDSKIIARIEKTMGLIDGFREVHPTTRAITRVKEGEVGRRLDQMWVTPEIAQHPNLRVGISKEQYRDSDHRPVIMDMPIDCANLAEGTTPVWTPHKTVKLKKKEEGEHSEAEREEMRSAFVENHRQREEGTIEEAGQGLLEDIYKATVNTTHEETTLQYPRLAQRAPYREGWGHKLDTWKKRIGKAERAIKRSDRDEIRSTLEAVEWEKEDTPLGMPIDKFQNLWQEWDSGDLRDCNTRRDEIKERLKKQREAITKHRTAQRTKELRERVAEAVKRRNENFEEKTGKGKGRVLASIFRKRREQHSLHWVRNSEGNLDSTPEGVAKTVKEFFEAWFKSRVSVKDRWGSKENMDNLEMQDPQYKKFVEDCYQQPRITNEKSAEEEGWWKDIMSKITYEEVKEAIKESKKNTAAGPSQVGIDIFKDLDKEGMEILAEFFNRCMTEGKVPDSINKALMRLLPKTDKGLSDMNLVRPIALIENLVKIYETIIIGRVLERIMRHQMLDLGQFGAIPKAGVQPHSEYWRI